LALFFGILEAKKTTWLPAIVGRPMSRKITANVLVVIAKVLLLSPWFCFLIWFDNNVIHLPVLFPRTRGEIMTKSQLFYRWIKTSTKWRSSKKSLTTSIATNILKNHTKDTYRLLSIQDHNILEHEPDKNVDTALLNITCVNVKNDEQTVIQLFVKFSCGRNFPLFLQGVRCATEWGLQRELDFFKSIGRLQHVLPCPTSVALGGNFAANRLCLVLDYVAGGIVTPDHTGANEYQALTVLKSAAKMHGYFWGMNNEKGAKSSVVLGNARSVVNDVEEELKEEETDREWIAMEIVSFLDKINARCGLEYFSFIRPCLDKKEEPIEFLKLWDGIELWFKSQNIPTTVVHGDCRLGNMMFIGKEKNQNPTESGQILFTDFEAVNVAPFLWDMVYFTVLCQTPESRKERHDMLLKEYLKSLKKTYLRTVSQRKKYNGTIIEEDQMPPESSNELYVLYDVLSLVLFYYSYTIERSGMWAGNGNTMEDLTNWTNRVDQRIQELDMEKMAKVLNVDVKWLLKVKHLEWDEPSEKSMSYKKRD
jgi:thiamine kinase-like enzyme